MLIIDSKNLSWYSVHKKRLLNNKLILGDHILFYKKKECQPKWSCTAVYQGSILFLV